MQENRHAPPRPGTGCPVEEPEVLPADYMPASRELRVGRVTFDRTTTLQSPCFWLLVGGVAVGAAVYLLMRENNRR